MISDEDKIKKRKVNKKHKLDDAKDKKSNSESLEADISSNNKSEKKRKLKQKYEQILILDIYGNSYSMKITENDRRKHANNLNQVSLPSGNMLTGEYLEYSLSDNS